MEAREFPGEFVRQVVVVALIASAIALGGILYFIVQQSEAHCWSTRQSINAEYQQVESFSSAQLYWRYNEVDLESVQTRKDIPKDWDDFERNPTDARLIVKAWLLNQLPNC
jgi:hypothetical protein